MANPEPKPEPLNTEKPTSKPHKPKPLLKALMKWFRVQRQAVMDFDKDSLRPNSIYAANSTSPKIPGPHVSSWWDQLCTYTRPEL